MLCIKCRLCAHFKPAKSVKQQYHDIDTVRWHWDEMVWNFLEILKIAGMKKYFPSLHWNFIINYWWIIIVLNVYWLLQQLVGCVLGIYARWNVIIPALKYDVCHSDSYFLWICFYYCRLCFVSGKFKGINIYQNSSINVLQAGWNETCHWT